jgi:mannose/fructose/N-acetylgalactosamine-specific phosphotransferase system component IID
MMNKASMLFSIFLRSLIVQASFNYRTMQGLGFAFAMLPLTGSKKHRDSRDRGDFLLRHSRMFSTNPYLLPAIAGSVVRMEEDGAGGSDVEDYKNALMGPYAALGDSFFWGVLRLFSSVWAVLFALSGSLYAPLLFLLFFTPPQIFVRVGGYVSGLRYGRGGFNYIRSLDLPRETQRFRYGALAVLGVAVAAAFSSSGDRVGSLSSISDLIIGSVIFLVSYWALKRGISSVKILYGSAVGCILFSIVYGYN